MKSSYILWFSEIGMKDVALVGGKNASLGELQKVPGIEVPPGFAVTTEGFRAFLSHNDLETKIQQVIIADNLKQLKSLQTSGKTLRKLIMDGEFPPELKQKIFKAYRELGTQTGTKHTDVAIRSSATAEDSKEASFAGEYDTYLHISGEKQILEAIKKCFASLFNDRALSYRLDKGFSQKDIQLAVTIQQMVRSDLGSSGVMFTLDTETGFDKALVISSSYGLGELVVQGSVIPDEFLVFKPLVEKNFPAIISRKLGEKKTKMVYADAKTKNVKVPEQDRKKLSLNDAEVLILAKWGIAIEKHFSAGAMDIEWARDGKNNKLFILQARPETVHSLQADMRREYELKQTSQVLLTGTAVGNGIGAGRVRILNSPEDMHLFNDGEILVSRTTNPDWEPIMKRASGIITDHGSRTSHAAIVSRELGIPAIVGTITATQRLKKGIEVTIDCSSGEVGKIYHGILPFQVREIKNESIPETYTRVMLNIGSPEEAFKHHHLPIRGIGLGRLEFIIASMIGIHPNALIEFTKLSRSRDASVRRTVTEISVRTIGFTDKKEFYIDRLTQGIAKLAALAWPHPAIIRFSDFKTNEYRKLVGGELYEPEEENPMLGWRGASRYTHPLFEKAFGLECHAIERVRNVLRFTNVVPMIPFCRTPDEGRHVVELMAQNGLDRKKDPSLKVYVMCEIPSNVILVDAFLDVFDGMSIGSNDLTQLTLGMDRDSGTISHIANENNPAVKTLITQAIQACKKRKKYIGICGQAPSDYPDFAKFLVEEGIESISLNPDSVISTTMVIAKAEKKSK